MVKINNCIMNGVIIEEYIDDYPHSSYLIFGYAKNNRIIHTVVCIDSESIGIITAYIPNKEKFENDLKTRKEF